MSVEMASATVVNPDLKKEREKTTFDVEKLTFLLYGGPDKTRRRRLIHSIAQKDLDEKNFKPWAFRTREERYENVVIKQLHSVQRGEELGFNFEDMMYYEEVFQANESNRIGQKNGMFPPTIQKQGTKEQREKILPLIKNHTIFGCYAQTELGHGTFIRGLESTATYDPKTQEFVLNTPTITSMKYWPGNLGKTVNFCVFLAQLYTKGECHGIHTFMLPIRDFRTHETLPGIEVGDIGPKMGFEENDNGYLRVNNVRIPRDFMLMRYAKVLEDGTYIKPENTKLTYGTLILTRNMLVRMASQALAQACVIAVRYSAVRRQTEVSPGGEEAQIIDYQTQQSKLFPILATAYAFAFVSKMVDATFGRIDKQIEQGSFGEMAELHALCAGLKAFTTWETSAAIEVCRMSCGGHGYSHASGLPKIYVSATTLCTVEGENTVMMLQTARYLVKSYMSFQSGGKLPGFISYLGNQLKPRSAIIRDVTLEDLQEAYEHRATRMVQSAAQALQKHVKSGLTQDEARNLTSTQQVWAASAHCHAYVLKAFVSVVRGSNLDEATRKAITSLCYMYALNGIHEKLGEFIQDGFFDSYQVDILTAKMMDVLAEIRPNAVAMVDAFEISDSSLDSCLGRYDGNVYQALYDYAKSSPLNEKDVLDSFHKYILPLRKANAKDGIIPAKL